MFVNYDFESFFASVLSRKSSKGGSSAVGVLFLSSRYVGEDMDFCFSLYLSTQGDGEPFRSEYTTLCVSRFVFSREDSRGDSRGSDSFGKVIGSDRKLLFREVALRESTAPSWHGGVFGFGTSSSSVVS